MTRIFFVLICLHVTFALPAKAHEFWLSPQSFVVEVGQSLRADLISGHKFKGSVYPFNPKDFVRFDVSLSGSTTKVQGTNGDRPALSMPMSQEGLAIIAYQSIERKITYYKWTKFTNFTAGKGYKELVHRHLERGLPETKFQESFRRFAKSLVSVGGAQGADRRLGLEVELVALANPYGDLVDGLVPIQFLYRGATKADQKITVFEQTAAGDILVKSYQTDDQGVARIVVNAGSRYMLDAVVIREDLAAGLSEKSVWESLWASMTFMVPSEG